jgi:endogenous inhibitor of DNA gyrase (YacG/DUF329 family)
MTESTHACPYCGGAIDLGDWSPYRSTLREVTCPTCARVATIEWDDSNGWFVWLSESAP